MNYIYRNDTHHAVLYRNLSWLPDELLESVFPVPDELGLTCIQSGHPPDPVLFHDDVIVPAGEQLIVSIDAPALGHAVILTISCMSPSAGVECRFGSSENKPIPIDARTFSQTIDWALCSHIFLLNPTDTEAVISVTAIECMSRHVKGASLCP